MMVNTLQLFFQLLQVAVGTRDKLSLHSTGSGQVCPSDKEWAWLYAMCKRQSLVGIGFAGIQRLPSEQRPALRQLAQWIHDSEKIKEKNERISKECGELCRQLKKDGMNCCILKGQSNLPNYPEWLRDYRNPGDIDVLIRPKDGSGVRGTIEYCIGQCKKHKTTVGKICYHHMELPWEGITEVEAHHRPSWMDSYIRNKRLQSWCERNMPFNNNNTFLRESQGKLCSAQATDVDFPVPAPEFNAIYQLVHIYRHLFEEGIGLRQILDYYFVLKKTPSAPLLRGEIMNTISRLGMKRFASAVMWVVARVFDPEELRNSGNSWMICQPNENEGKFLLREILMAGNFGRYDKRIAIGSKSFMGFKVPGGLIHNWEKLKHNFRLIRHYPEEVLWEPVFRLYHFLWRKLELWRY